MTVLITAVKIVMVHFSAGQSYRTFYLGNLLSFQGKTVILCCKAMLPWELPWNDCKLPWNDCKLPCNGWKLPWYLCNQYYKI